MFGAVTLGAVLGLTRTRLPREAATWAHLSVLAVAQCVVPWLLFSWAEQSISSGLASIYNATTPLMTMSVALAFLPGEKLTDAKLFGLLLGFTGGGRGAGAVAGGGSSAASPPSSRASAPPRRMAWHWST